MPKRKNTRPKASFIQQKTLKTRLLQISVRLEEYVYENKPIGFTEAKDYIDEIAGYKIHCCGDKYSMQVIEKLTRCMTGIINEQLSLNPEITNIDVNETQTCVSPVYSLPDEDKLYTQASLADKEKFIKNIESHSSGEGKGWINHGAELQIPVDIVDLCSNDEDNRNNIDIVDVEVHRALSNLSIIDNDGQTEIDESQSILENFEQGKQPIKTSSTIGTKVNSIVQNTTITKVMNHIDLTEPQAQNILDSFHQNNTQSDNIIHQEGTIPTILHNTNDNTQEEKTIVMQNLKKYILERQNLPNISNLNDIVTKPGTLKTVKCTPLLLSKNFEKITQVLKENVANNLNAKKSCKKRNNKNKSKANKAVCRRRKTKKNGDNKQTGTNKFNKSNIDRTKDGVIKEREELINKNETFKDNISTGRNTQTLHSHKSANANSKGITTTIPKIYNKKTEDDLSWVENIKYVREITANEFDPKLASIEDAFWDNLTFPSEWNDQDFNLY